MKKLLAVLIAVVMCFTVFGMVASADAFAPEVYLKLTYADNEAKIITANITTSEACGAIEATLKYTGATYKEDSAKFIETSVEDSKFVLGDNTVKFVIATDDVTVGDTNWATFNFDVTGDANFELVDVSVCDKTATDIKEGVTVPAANITVSAPLRTLGAQYRPEGEQAAALRFGSDLKVNTETFALDVKGNEYSAVSCGYIIGFDFNIAEKSGDAKAALNTYVSLEDDELVAEAGKGVLVKTASYYFISNPENMIYTYAITGFFKNGDAVKSGEHVLAEENISVLPYVIYKTDAGYDVAFGTEISRSYNDVVNAYELAN